MASKVILIVYGSGGHQEQMRRLLVEMKNNNPDRIFISFCDTNVNNPLTKKYFRNFEIKKELALIYKLPVAYFKAFCHIQKIRRKGYEIKAAISTGPGIGLVYLSLLKLLKVHTIFFESWSRFHTQSFTGKILYSVVDIFIVQNKEGILLYPEAKYLKGRL